MRVVFITFHYRPSNEVGARRPTAFSERLAARGHGMTVVSAFGGGAPDLHTQAGRQNVEIYAVPEPRKWFVSFLVRAKAAARRLLRRQTPGETQAQRASNSPGTESLSGFVLRVLYLVDTYKLWSWRAATAATRIVRRDRADVVCSSGPPHSNHIAAYLVSRRCRIPLVVDLRDPWGIGYTEAMQKRGFPLRVTLYFERRVLPHAAAITVTTDDLAQALAGAYPALQGKIHVVRNGYDGAQRPPLRATGHRLSILYAGATYVNRNPFELLDAVERLLARADVDDSKVELVFIGHCEAFRGIRLRDWMSGKRCDAVTRILPPVRASELEPYIDRATLLLNFAQGQPWAIPAKTYEHMASGHELLVLCESDSATGRLIGGIAGVSIVDPRNAMQLDDTLNDLYRRHVVEGVPRVPSDEDVVPFSRERQSESFVRIVESIRAS